MSSKIEKEIVQATETEYQTVQQVMESLAGLEKLFRSTKDKRGIFVVAYSDMTGRLQKIIHRQEKQEAKVFNDVAWVKAYLLAFANLYRKALYGSTAGLVIPGAWQVAFEKTTDRGILTLQHLMLGINAHIAHDLAVALHQVGIGSDKERRVKEGDHYKINAVLKDATDPIQQKITHYHRARGLGVLDSFFLRLDEWFTQQFFERQRTKAWLSAVELTGSFEDSVVNDVKARIDSQAMASALEIAVWRFPYIVAEFFGPDENAIVEIISPDENQLTLMKEIEGKKGEDRPESWDWTQVI